MRTVIRYTAVGLVCTVAIALIWRSFVDRTVTREIHLVLGVESQSIGVEIDAPILNLRLIALDLPPREADEGQLVFDSLDEQSTVHIAKGDSVSLEERDYEVATIRVWSGLLRRPPGVPMLNLAVQPSGEEWIENVFLQLDTWSVITPDIALFAGRKGASAAAIRARWGVVEGDRTHWFTSFVPGTGVELDDGTIVTLLAREPSARILVEFANGGERRRDWFHANDSSGAEPIRYEDASAAKIRVEIGMEDADRPNVSIVEEDLQLRSRTVNLGEIVSDGELDLHVRVDQVETDAFPLLASESPFLEVVLVNDSRVIRIREGEAIRVGENNVSFEAIAKPRHAGAEIEVDGASHSFDENTVLELGDWRLDAFRALNPSEAAVRVTYEQSRRPFRLGLTGACIAVAAAVLAVARRQT